MEHFGPENMKMNSRCDYGLKSLTFWFPPRPETTLCILWPFNLIWMRRAEWSNKTYVSLQNIQTSINWALKRAKPSKWYLGEGRLESYFENMTIKCSIKFLQSTSHQKVYLPVMAFPRSKISSKRGVGITHPLFAIHSLEFFINFSDLKFMSGKTISFFSYKTSIVTISSCSAENSELIFHRWVFSMYIWG